MLKTPDHKVAQKLSTMGFRYVIEHMGNIVLYCFPEEEKLNNIIASQFADYHFIKDDKLHF